VEFLLKIWETSYQQRSAADFVSTIKWVNFVSTRRNFELWLIYIWIAFIVWLNIYIA